MNAREQADDARVDVSAEPGAPLPQHVAELLDEYPYVAHPQAEVVLEQLEFLLRARAAPKGKVKGVRLVGLPNCGKTSLLAEVVRRYPPVWDGVRWHYRVLYVPFSERATLHSVYQDILKALGDPAYDQGTLKQLRTRCKKLLKAAGVTMVLFDEPHHLTEQRSTGTRIGLVELSKTLLTDRIVVVFAGVHSVDDLCLLRAEMARRFSSRYELRPYLLRNKNELRVLRDFAKRSR